MTLADRYWRDGYAHVPGIFTREEVLRWRQRALDPSARGDELLSDPVLREILLHPKLIAVAKEVLEGAPVYFGNSNISRGDARVAGFHKDNSDRYDAKAPDWSTERYPIMQFGVYMQEHGELPGGLDLRKGSHLHPDVTTGEHVSPAIELGDLLIWTGRTTHSSHSKVIRGIGYRMEPNGILWRIVLRAPPLSLMFRPHPEERLVAIGAVGVVGPLLDRHIAYLQTRTDRAEAWRKLDWTPETLRKAEEAGLDLMTPDELLAGVPAKTNDQYVQLPY